MGGGEYIFPKKMERILNVAAAVAQANCPPAFRDLLSDPYRGSDLETAFWLFSSFLSLRSEFIGEL